jgi:glycosyltransferase involved in cell wall biosynthesis
MIFFDDGGPTSRKTTLAAALAHGVPTVALDGEERWTQLLEAGAVEIVAPNLGALVEALTGLLTDMDRRQRMAGAARAFYHQAMSTATVAQRIEEAMTIALECRRKSRQNRLKTPRESRTEEGF